VIVFRNEAGRYRPEFKFLDRYLSLYDRWAGPPQFLSLHVWSYGMYYRGFGRDGGREEKRASTIPIVELQGDRLLTVEAPIFGGPGSEAMWREVMDGLRQCVRRLGWPESCILVGTSGDTWPHRDTVRLFHRVAPYARWRAMTHGNGVPHWGLAPEDRTQPNDMIVAYCEMARRIRNGKVKNPACPVTCNARDCVKSDPFDYRSLPPSNVISGNFDGIAWKGLDYWTYLTPEGTRRSALNTYVRFGNLVGSTPRTLAVPGPKGAVATVQYEALREGIQDCEAMLFLQDVLAVPEQRAKIDKDLVARCESAIDEMLALLETGLRYHPHGGGDLERHARRLHEAAAEAWAALQGTAHATSY
jgi:hypothetical protein